MIDIISQLITIENRPMSKIPNFKTLTVVRILKYKIFPEREKDSLFSFEFRIISIAYR